LLLVVAFTLQASAGLIEPKHFGEARGEAPNARQVAETVTRKAVRFVRRETIRPAIRLPSRAASASARHASPPHGAQSSEIPPRRPLAHEADLPPPGAH